MNNIIEKILNISYDNINNNNILTSKIKSKNLKNLSKNNCFLIEIVFINSNNVSENMLNKYLQKTNCHLQSYISENIMLIIVPILETNLFNVLNILKNLNNDKIIKHYMFCNYKNIPLYIFDEYELIKNNSIIITV